MNHRFNISCVKTYLGLYSGIDLKLLEYSS